MLEVSAYPGIHASYLWQNLAITLWFNAATMDSLARYAEGGARFCGNHPEGISTVHIMVPGGKSMPTAEARAELGRIIRELSQNAVAAVAIIPGSGFWASAMRGLVTAVAMLAPRGFNLQTFASISQAAQWLAPIHSSGTGVRVESAELERILEHALRVGTAAAA